jgi:hypothetical protein
MENTLIPSNQTNNPANQPKTTAVDFVAQAIEYILAVSRRSGPKRTRMRALIRR